MRRKARQAGGDSFPGREETEDLVRLSGQGPKTKGEDKLKKGSTVTVSTRGGV